MLIVRTWSITKFLWTNDSSTKIYFEKYKLCNRKMVPFHSVSKNVHLSGIQSNFSVHFNFFSFFLIFSLFIWIFLRSIELEADQISLMSCSCNKMDEKHPYLPKWCIEKGVMDTFCHKKTFLWNVTNYENTSFFGDFTKNHPSVLSVVVCFVMGVWFGSKDWQT